MNHSTEANASCSGKSYSDQWMGNVYPGIWKDWDDENGFDDVKTSGDLTNAPYVTAEYWLDSLWEPELFSAGRKDAPLVNGWLTEGYLLDTGYMLSGDGYFVLAAGGLRIAEPGEYELSNTASQGFLMWLDKNHDGQIDIVDTSEAVFGERRDDGFAGWNSGTGKRDTITLTFDTPGPYKCVFWYWNWGEVGHLELYWKKPGMAERVPIPGNSPPDGFGKPGGGPPAVRITTIAVDGVERDESNWGNLDVAECQPVRFTAEATGMQGETPLYIWDFHGNGQLIETPDPVIEYRYVADPSVFLVQPAVRVKRGDLLSDPSSMTEVVFVWLTDDPAVNNCAKDAVVPRARPSVRSQAEARIDLYTIGGRRFVARGGNGPGRGNARNHQVVVRVLQGAASTRHLLVGSR